MVFYCCFVFSLAPDSKTHIYGDNSIANATDCSDNY